MIVTLGFISSYFQHTFRRGEVYNYNKTRGVPCTAEKPVPWMHGESLMTGMKDVSILMLYFVCCCEVYKTQKEMLRSWANTCFCISHCRSSWLRGLLFLTVCIYCLVTLKLKWFFKDQLAKFFMINTEKSLSLHSCESIKADVLCMAFP